MPFSGAYSAYASIGKTQAAYMKMINEQGGINGRKLNLIQYDDAYSPPKTVEQVRKLVEGDEVLFTFQIIGTAAERRRAEISQRQEGAAAARLHRRVEASPIRKNCAVDHGLQSELLSRRRASTRKYILNNHPNAKIGILYQNDDLGRDYITGLKAGLGDKAATHDRRRSVLRDVTDPTIDSQVVKLKARRRRPAFYDASTPKFGGAGDQEGRRARLEAGPHPRHQCEPGLGHAASRPGSTSQRASSATNYGKDPGDPQWKDDAGREGLFRLHGQILSRRRQAQHRQHLRLFDRANCWCMSCVNAATI